LPDSRNQASVDGTDAHDWGANVLLGNCTIDDVPSEHRRGVKMYVDHVATNSYDSMILERQWHSLSINDFFGTVDCLLLNGSSCAIYDYKNGTYDVQAEGNKQLLSYASIIAEHFNVDTFYGVIVQPNSKARQKIKVAEYSLGEVDAHRDAVREAAVRTDKVPGRTQCYFCPLMKAGMCAEGKALAIEQNWSHHKHVKHLF